MHKLPLLIIILIGISFTPLSFSEDIPEWVKNNASWWSERQISQSEFTNGLEFLINEGIIYIPATESGITGPDKSIPDWVRNTAGWWSDDLIPDSEFVNAMKYLIEIGLIEVDASSSEVTVEETVEEIPETPETTGVPLMLLLEGYDTVTPEKRFVLDLLVFDAEMYPQASPTFNRNLSYTVDGVKLIQNKIYSFCLLQFYQLYYHFDNTQRFFLSPLFLLLHWTFWLHLFYDLYIR